MERGEAVVWAEEGEVARGEREVLQEGEGDTSREVELIPRIRGRAAAAGSDEAAEIVGCTCVGLPGVERIPDAEVQRDLVEEAFAFIDFEVKVGVG
jgi:hypothetical protein